MCPFSHQWSARYPAEYSTIRTRTAPKWRVRQRAVPDSPACSVASIVSHAVMPNGMSVRSMVILWQEGESGGTARTTQSPTAHGPNGARPNVANPKGAGPNDANPNDASPNGANGASTNGANPAVIPSGGEESPSSR